MEPQTTVTPCAYAALAWRLNALPIHIQDDLVEEMGLTESEVTTLRAIARGKGGVIRGSIWAELEKALSVFEAIGPEEI